MATKWTSPTWRMPEESNQSKFENYSLSFDGAFIEDIQLGTTTFLLPGQPSSTSTSVSNPKFSASIFFNFNSSVAGAISLMIGAGQAGGARYWSLRKDSNDNLQAMFRITNGAYATITGGTTLSHSTWYHACVTWDGDNINLYLNGVSDATQVAATTFYYSSTISHPTIGSFRYSASATSNEWEGKLSQATVFDYALSQAQVNYLFNNNAGGSTPNPQNPMAISGNAPIAYYPLGGSSTGDAAVSSPSTLTVPNESVPSATVFDFVSADGDRINVGPSGAVGTGPINSINGAITISIWVNTTSTSGNEYPIMRDFTGSDWRFRRRSDTNRIHLAFLNTSSATLNVELTGTNDPQGNPYISIVDGSWHHLVGIYNGTDTAELYIDGVLQGTNTIADFGTLSTTARTVIGGYNNSNGNPLGGNGSWNGKLSNAQIWDTNLSSSEVTTLYNNGVPLLSGTQPQATNLKAWYPMNVDTSNWDGSDWVIGDSVSQFATAYSIPNTNNDNNVSPYGGNSKLISGGSFLSVADSILAPSASVLSISCWVKLDNPDVNFYDNIISQVNGATAHSFRIMKWRNNGTGNWTFGTINFALYSNGTTAVNVNVDKAQFTPQANTWFNIICTYDGTTMRVFINNKLCGSGTSMSGDFAGNTNNRFIIGKNANSIYGGLQGAVSNVQVWNSTLTGGDGLSVGDQGVGEIAQLYNNGTPLASSIPQTSSLLGWWKLESDLNDYSGNNKTLTAYGNEGGNANSISPVPSAISSLVSTLNGTSSGMTTANLVNSDLTRSIPYSSYSMTFDGTSNEYINCGHAALTAISGGSNTLSTSMSVSMWFKLGSSSSSRGLINFGSLGNTYGGFTIRHQSSVFSFLKESTHLVSGGYTFTNTSEWHHMAFVYDPSSASNCYLYIDGVDTGVSFVNVGNLSFQNSNLTNRNLIIGAYYGDADTFTGSISNCSIYNKLLTTNQVLTIYNGGVPNDISSLSPTGWWSLGGDSYFNGNDFICPDLSSNSNNGTSSGMGGTELVGSGPGSTANGTATGMNIPANLQGNAPNSTKNAFSINMAADDKTSSVPDISS